MTEQEYIEFIQPYIDAEQNLMTRLEILNKDFQRKDQNPPIHYLQNRIKKKDSIETKLKKYDCALTPVEAKNNLMDISGIRVIAYFIDDIYELVEMIKRQLDLIIIKERDYIKTPKPNGYRSYHIILGIPVYHTDVMEYFPVEVQLRTMSMDFWASMEHRICYKKNIRKKKALAKELLRYAEQLESIESDFEKYNDHAT